MDVFISWSGKFSHQVALILKEWLPCAIPDLQPWVSSEDISKGTRWGSELAAKLEACNFGIVCVTPDNQTEPWLNFEAGALSKSFEFSRVVPFVVGLNAGEIRGPLSQFQVAVFEEGDVLRMLKSINSSMSSGSVSGEQLSRAFKQLWPSLNSQLSALPLSSSSTEVIPSSDEPVPEQLFPVEDEELKIMTIFAESGEQKFTASELAQHLQLNQTKVRYHLDRLLDADYIGHILRINGPEKYYITKEGRKFVIERGLI